MLQFIRDRATGWVATGIIGLICIPFAMWGVSDYLGPDPEVTVATVGGEELPLQTLQRAFAREQQRMRSLLGSAWNPDAIDDEQLRERTLDSLIDEEVLVQAAREHGMRVGDGQLAATIRTQDAFRNDGVFSEEAYQSWLRSQGHSPGSFERDLRRSMIVQQMRVGLSRTEIVSDRDLVDTARLQAQKRTFSLLTVPAANFAGARPSDEEVRAYYEEHRDEFVTPEQVKLRYVEVSRPAIAAAIRPDESELRAAYESQKLNYVEPERRSARHILLRVGEDADEAAVDRARARLQSYKARIEEGSASFADLATEHSDDPGSAADGGDLGAIGRDMFDPAFEEAVYALEEGEISEPVRTSFGLHLVQVTEVVASETKTFEEARDEVLADLRRRRAEQIFFERVEQLATLAFEHPDALAPASDAVGAPVRETGYFGRDGVEADGASDDGGEDDGGNDPIAASEAVVRAAFSPVVLEDGLNSEPIDLEGDRVVVIRVADHRRAEQQPLEAVRARVAERLSERAARRAAAEAGAAILARLREGASPEQAAAEADLEWVRYEGLDRYASEVPRPLRRAVFRVPRPQGGAAATYDAVADESGDFVVIALHAVEDGGAGDIADERDAVRGVLAGDLGQIAFDAFVASRRDAAEIEVARQRLER